MAMVSATKIVLIAALVVSLGACSRNSEKPENRQVEPNGPAEGAVRFEIKPVESEAGSHQWVATYAVGGKIAKFRIELGASKASNDTKLPISSGSGRFLSEPGSDPRAFLIDLKKALEAKAVPSKVQKVASLPFEFVILGENQSRSSDGGFSDKPRGDWMAMKIFLAGGEGEVFFNLSPATNEAEFSIKDADYSDIVLTELAKVL